MATLKLGVLGSGSGSNMQSIVDAIERGELDAEIKLVLADVPDAKILDRAKRHSIPCRWLDCAPWKTKLEGAAEEECIRLLKEAGCECFFEKEGIYTFDGKGELLLTIMSSLAQEESRSISENVTWGQRKRFADGKVSFGYSSFLGYDRGAKKGDPPVINEEQAEKAIACGSKFIVGPGFSAKVAAVCRKHGIPYLPGCVTPTEIIAAIDEGIEIVKFFPASDFGGLKAIKSLAAAFPAMKFLPTGGISDANVLDYLAFPKIVACGGSWMMKGTPDEIKEKTAKAMELVK